VCGSISLHISSAYKPVNLCQKAELSVEEEGTL
jgi:hypothetical protein